MKSLVSAFMVSLILVALLAFTLDIRPVRAQGTIYIRADGSIDPPTANITTADNVTYSFTDNNYDSIVVERSSIVIDGAGYTLQGTGSGDGMSLSGITYVTVRNIRITSFWVGVRLSSASHCNISGSDLTANEWAGLDFSHSSFNDISGNALSHHGSWGIHLVYSSNNSISGNSLTANWEGMSLYSSSNNSISDNEFTSEGLYVVRSYQNSMQNNTVNGKPLIYLEDAANCSVGDAGLVVLVNCDSMKVQNLNLSGTGVGLQLWQTNNSIVSNNTMTNTRIFGIYTYSAFNNSINENTITYGRDGIGLDYSSSNRIVGNNIAAKSGDGIVLWHSSNNSINGNNITGNWCGLWLDDASNNSIYHNIFNNRVYEIHLERESANAWDEDYPSGGNYWSDYTGADLYRGPHQNVSGSDGVGDTPYVIDEANQDNYPLMKPHPWNSHDIGIVAVEVSRTVVMCGQHITVNTTVFNYGNHSESFNVTVHANGTVIGLLENVTLASRNSTALAIHWGTIGFAKGNFTITIHVTPVSGEIDISDNTLTGWAFISIPGDVDGDRDVDIFDIVLMASGYGTLPSNPKYHPNCDVDGDGDIDIFDIVIAADRYGQSW